MAVERRADAALEPKERSGATLPAWAALCFFTSGAAGLVYEAVWSKQLSYLLGSSLHAVATVVAAFLGGLALGARFLGVRLARRPGRLRAYALLELGVAVAAALLLPALHALDPLVGVLYRALGAGSVGFGLARLLLLFVVLVPPAALMGATLPVLVAEFERGRVGPALARLYALNTFGAVTGFDPRRVRADPGGGARGCDGRRGHAERRGRRARLGSRQTERCACRCVARGP